MSNSLKKLVLGDVIHFCGGQKKFVLQLENVTGHKRACCPSPYYELLHVNTQSSQLGFGSVQISLLSCFTS